MGKFIEVKEIPLNPENGATYAICNSDVAYLTHGFFKYPCKYIPQIPAWAIKKFLVKKSTILDPFCGSGTTLLEASLKGHKGLGIEIDKFGQLLTRVKTQKVSPSFSKKILIFKKKFENLDKTKKEKRPNIVNFDLWFSDSNAVLLGKINYLIEKTKNDQEVYDFLRVCFASLIRKASNADEVSPKPYVSKKYKKQNRDIEKEFIKIIDKYLDRTTTTAKLLGPDSEIVGDDARTISLKRKVDLVVTSPPYINAFDYVRTLRLENLWLGLQSEEELKSVKKLHIGTESVDIKKPLEEISFLTEELEKVFRRIYRKDKKRAFVVLKYFNDMNNNIQSVSKVLRKDGYYVIVVGNSMIRGIEVSTHKILIEIASKIGFNNDLVFSYLIKNRYLRIPRSGRGGFIKKDWVICLKK